MTPEYEICSSFRIEERRRLLELLGQHIALLRQQINEMQQRKEKCAASLVSQQRSVARTTAAPLPPAEQPSSE